MAELRFAVPRLGLVVLPVLIMLPGIYALEAIASLNRSSMLYGAAGNCNLQLIYWRIGNGIGDGAASFPPNDFCRMA